MLAVRRLVELIESHIEQLSRELREKAWNAHQCSDLRKVPGDELEARTREIYRNLCDWLQDKAETEVERRYTELGARRAQQGVSYSHVYWAITATKQHVYGFIQREGLSDNAMELRGELELLHLLGQFFDHALYYIALGFEQERDRIGGKQRRRKGDV
jgi:RsbT co-antagonist protein rsbRD N-terminal domain